MKTCKTCSNEVWRPHFRQCDDCIGQGVNIEDYEAGEAILDRVMAGLCQNCGKKEGCTCPLISSEIDSAIVGGLKKPK